MRKTLIIEASILTPINSGSRCRKAHSAARTRDNSTNFYDFVGTTWSCACHAGFSIKYARSSKARLKCVAKLCTKKICIKFIVTRRNIKSADKVEYSFGNYKFDHVIDYIHRTADALKTIKEGGNCYV